METKLTNEDLRNITVLISKANITGQDATAVAILLQKIQKMLEPPKEDVQLPKK